jgi:hypothetical protein
METRLVGIERSATTTELAASANNLIGKPVPGYPELIVVRIKRFQMSPRPEGYDALILVEVTETQEPLNLKAADIEAIIEITSAVDEPEMTA